MKTLLSAAAGLTPRQAGFTRDVGWTIRQMPIAADGPRPRHVWCTVADDGTEEVGVQLGRTQGDALAALQRMSAT